MENLPQHLSEKFIDYPISLGKIEIYQLSVSPRAFLKLSVIYRYRFSSERFIVPITDYDISVTTSTLQTAYVAKYCNLMAAGTM